MQGDARFPFLCRRQKRAPFFRPVRVRQTVAISFGFSNSKRPCLVNNKCIDFTQFLDRFGIFKQDPTVRPYPVATIWTSVWLDRGAGTGMKEPLRCLIVHKRSEASGPAHAHTPKVMTAWQPQPSYKISGNNIDKSLDRSSAALCLGDHLTICDTRFRPPHVRLS